MGETLISIEKIGGGSTSGTVVKVKKFECTPSGSGAQYIKTLSSLGLTLSQIVGFTWWRLDTTRYVSPNESAVYPSQSKAYFYAEGASIAVVNAENVKYYVCVFYID